MKIKQILITSGIAATLALGVGVGLGSPLKASEVKAADVPAEIYFEFTGSAWANWGVTSDEMYAYFIGGETAWRGDKATSVETINAKEYCKFTVPSDVTQVVFNFFHDGWNDEWSHQTVDLDIPTDGKNAFRITVQDNYKYTGEWFVLGQTEYAVTRYAVKDGVLDSKELGSSVVAAGGSYSVPANILADYYSFDGWFLDEACDTEMTEAITVNEDTSIYAKLTSIPAYTGTIKLDLGYAENCSTWGGAETHFAAVLLADGWNHQTWTSYVASAEGKYFVELPYSVGYEPEKMVIIRYPGDYTEADWNENKWPESKWQSSEFAFCTQFALTSGESIKDESNITVDTGVSGESWSTTAFLNNVQMNGEGHTEYYSKSVYLTEGNAFKVFNDGDAFAKVSFHKSVAANFSQPNEGDDIQILVEGTYCIYFDTYKLSFYVTTEDYANADVWGELFLEGMVCDGNGNITTDKWSALADSYAALPNSVKEVFLSIAEDGSDDTYAESAVKRYDYIIKKYGTAKYNDFMGRGYDENNNPTGILYPASSINNLNIMNEDNYMTVIIVIIAAASALAFTTLLVIKKRKSK